MTNDIRGFLIFQRFSHSKSKSEFHRQNKKKHGYISRDIVVKREIPQVYIQQHQLGAQSEVSIRCGAPSGQPALLRAQNHTCGLLRELIRFPLL